jgi:hypothetical protein
LGSALFRRRVSSAAVLAVLASVSMDISSSLYRTRSKCNFRLLLVCMVYNMPYIDDPRKINLLEKVSADL